MDYLIEFIITIPDDAPPPEIEQRLAGETTRVAELAVEGHALRVWTPLPEDGRRAGPWPIPGGLRPGAAGDPRLAAHASLDGDLGDGPGRAPQRSGAVGGMSGGRRRVARAES
jgi:hypothetical protein